MNLVLSARGPEALELRLSRIYRGGLTLVASVLAIAMLFALVSDGSIALIPLVLLLLSGAAALYEERWIFTPREIESRTGLLFLYKRRFLAADKIEGFRLTSFTKGRLSGTDPDAPAFLPSYAVLACETVDGDSLTIEILKFRKKEELETKAAAVADLCSKPLISELTH